jgi:UbiD family decarboxylase
LFTAVERLGRAEERGQPLEIAVVIGCDPMLYMASQVTPASGVDE